MAARPRRKEMNSGLKIPIIVLVSGAVVMSLELIASRIFAPYFGSTLYVWGSLIGIILTALAIGYWLGGRLADRTANGKTLANMLLFAGMFILLIPFIASKILPILKVLGPIYGPLIATVALLSIPGLLLGMVPPYALKLSARKINTLGSVAGNLYSLSTIGSILGTFLTSFVLIPMVGITNIVFLLGTILIIMSFLSYRRPALSVAVLLYIFVVPGYLLRLNSVFSFAGNELAYQKVYETDSSFYHITVAVDRETGNEQVLFLDSLRQSSMYLDRPNETSFDYPYYFNAAFAFNPEIRKVLFIGGGGMSAPKKFLEMYEEIEIDVVEIDPEVVRIAKEYFAVPNDSRLDIHVEDGRMFLEKTDEKYDLIVLDAYSGDYVPYHLMTMEFFRLIRSRLSSEGVVAFNLITPIEGELSRLFRSEYKTMGSVFENIHVLPLGSVYLSGNVILIATARASPMMESPFLNKLYRDKIDITDAQLLTDDYAPVDMINPVQGTAFGE
jgi:spermidine synthase